MCLELNDSIIEATYWSQHGTMIGDPDKGKVPSHAKR